MKNVGEIEQRRFRNQRVFGGIDDFQRPGQEKSERISV